MKNIMKAFFSNQEINLHPDFMWFFFESTAL